jgi:hypothetical protein
MTASDKNDIFRAFESITQVLSDFETLVNMLNEPSAEISTSDGVLAICGERKI